MCVIYIVRLYCSIFAGSSLKSLWDATFKNGYFGDFKSTLFNTAHLPPLKFHYVGGYWDRTQDCCDHGVGRVDTLSIRLGLIRPLVVLVTTKLYDKLSRVMTDLRSVLWVFCLFSDNLDWLLVGTPVDGGDSGCALQLQVSSPVQVHIKLSICIEFSLQPRIPFMYSFTGNCAASVPMSVSDLYIPRISPHT